MKIRGLNLYFVLYFLQGSVNAACTRFFPVRGLLARCDKNGTECTDNDDRRDDEFDIDKAYAINGANKEKADKFKADSEKFFIRLFREWLGCEFSSVKVQYFGVFIGL